MEARLESNHVQNLIEEYLAILGKDRDRQILDKRHALNSFKNHTLEEIGNSLGITRERVRQIEKAAVAKISKNHTHDHQFNVKMNEILEEMGGLVAFKELIDKLGINPKQENNILFLLKTNPNFTILDGRDKYDCIVLDGKTYCGDDITELHDELLKIIKEIKEPVHVDKLIEAIGEKHHSNSIKQLVIASNLLHELNDRWGLKSWPTVNPKNISDRIYIVLQQNKKPMHFSDISSNIHNLKKNLKKVTTQAVHNELIKDKRFILIGRGIYALKEWGYESGTVADIITDILKKNSPLTKDEIVAAVLKRRQVKKATIALNLQEKPQFTRLKKGLYSLSE